jgi:DNA-binding MarR family transcriptional regulator
VADLWLDPEDQTVWRQFLRANVELQRCLTRDLQSHDGLSGADYGVLVHLSEAPERRLRVYQLAECIEWEKSRLSHHLARMAQRGLIRREGCPTDSRGAYVALTDAGSAAVVAAAPRHVALVRRVFVEALSPEQRTALGEVTAAILQAVAAEEGASDRMSASYAPDGPG